MTVTRATRRETTRAASTSVVLRTALDASRVPGLLKVRAIVSRMFGRKAVAGSILGLVVAAALGGAYYWRHRPVPPTPAPKTALVLNAPLRPASRPDALPTPPPTPTPLPP